MTKQKCAKCGAKTYPGTDFCRSCNFKNSKCFIRHCMRERQSEICAHHQDKFNIYRTTVKWDFEQWLAIFDAG